MSNTFVSQSDRDQHQRQAAFDAAVQKGIEDIYGAYPNIKHCTASTNRIIDLVNRWMGEEVVPTPELMRAMLDENPEAFSTLALQSVDDQRAILLDEICSLLASKNKPNQFGAVKGGLYSPADLKAYRQNVLQWKTKEELAQFKADIVQKRLMNEMSVQQLKQVVAASKPVPRRDGYAVLPEYLVMKGQIQASRIDAEFLKNLWKTDYEAFKTQIVRRYGATQTNERMQGL